MEKNYAGCFKIALRFYTQQARVSQRAELFQGVSPYFKQKSGTLYK
ncbi:MAG: hypothetical protein JWP12_3084 [Bacteroidetes bacterium]|nr:hypothetical protein [Bacteroidota bacterium]